MNVVMYRKSGSYADFTDMYIMSVKDYKSKTIFNISAEHTL